MSNPILDARRASMALHDKYGDKVKVTLYKGEVYVLLTQDQSMDGDIEKIADVVERLYDDGRRVALKNRDNFLTGPLPVPLGGR